MVSKLKITVRYIQNNFVDKIKIITAPNLKLPNIKISEYIVEVGGYDTILLNLYEELEEEVRLLVNGKIGFEEFMNNISRNKIIPQPVESWFYPIEPIIRALQRVKKAKNLEIHCYRDLNCGRKLHEISTEILILTAKSKIFKKINFKDWKRILELRIMLKRKMLEIEANKVHSRIKGLSLCIAGLYGRKLGEILSKMGRKVEIEEVMEEYYLTPLEELEVKLERGFIDDDEIERYVKEHLKYIENYVLNSENIDEAYFKWLYDNYPHLRSKIDLNEISLLKTMIKKYYI